MLEDLYQFIRTGTGFSLVMLGLGMNLQPGLGPGRKTYARLNISVGLLFCLSAVDPYFSLPLDAGNVVIAVLIFMVAQSSKNLIRFLFGGHRSRHFRLRMDVAGLIITQASWLVPLLDYAFGWQPVTISLEDGNALGPLHLASSFVIYAWPLLACLLALLNSRWQLSDLKIMGRGKAALGLGVWVVILILVGVIISVISGMEIFYQISNFLLESFMLGWYLIMNYRPRSLERVRTEVKLNHERKQLLDADESKMIERRLGRLMAEQVFLSAGLDLDMLARSLKVPSYRLSRYFNDVLGTTFPVWLNQNRIRWVCKTMESDPDRAILDIATDAGYGSKSAFNTQFNRLMGMTPGEWKRSRDKPGPQTSICSG